MLLLLLLGRGLRLWRLLRLNHMLLGRLWLLLLLVDHSGLGGLVLLLLLMWRRFRVLLRDWR